MKAKRRFNIWLWVLLCVPCLLASCDHDVHSDEEENGIEANRITAIGNGSDDTQNADKARRVETTDNNK